MSRLRLLLVLLFALGLVACPVDRSFDDDDVADDDDSGHGDDDDAGHGDDDDATGDDDDAGHGDDDDAGHGDDDDAGHGDDDDAGHGDDDDAGHGDDDDATGDDDDATGDDDDATPPTGCPSGAQSESESEGNDEPPNADSFTPTGNVLCVTGTNLCGPVSTQEDFDDVDFFTITLPSPGLTVTMDTLWTDGSLDVDGFLFEGSPTSFNSSNPLVIPADGAGTAESGTATISGTDITFLVGCKLTPGATASYELVLSW